MKISPEKRVELYLAIHENIMDTRVKLKLSANDDFVLSQTIDKIWNDVKLVLKIPPQY